MITFIRILIVCAFALIAHQELQAETPPKPEIEAIQKYDASSYLGAYELVKNGIFQITQNGQKVIVVTMKRTDKTDAPAVAFIESNPTITVDDLKASVAIKVTLTADKKRLVVEYLDKGNKPYFRSELNPF